MGAGLVERGINIFILAPLPREYNETSFLVGKSHVLPRATTTKQQRIHCGQLSALLHTDVFEQTGEHLWMLNNTYKKQLSYCSYRRECQLCLHIPVCCANDAEGFG